MRIFLLELKKYFDFKFRQIISKKKIRKTENFFQIFKFEFRFEILFVRLVPRKGSPVLSFSDSLPQHGQRSAPYGSGELRLVPRAFPGEKVSLSAIASFSPTDCLVYGCHTICEKYHSYIKAWKKHLFILGKKVSR